MSNANDFVIENGVLIKYTGKDTVVEIPEGITAIGDKVFYFGSEKYGWNPNSDKIEKIIIPQGVLSIGERAFAFCNNLKEINIPDSVVSIGEGALSHCESLKEIFIPDSVKTIGHSVFYGCSSLEKVRLPKGIKEIPGHMFYNCKSLAEFVIPNSVKKIGWYAFGYTSLKEVNIPKGVKKMDGGSFVGCKIEVFDIPAHITTIDSRAVASPVLKKLIIRADSAKVSSQLFYEKWQEEYNEVPPVEIYCTLQTKAKMPKNFHPACIDISRLDCPSEYVEPEIINIYKIDDKFLADQIIGENNLDDAFDGYVPPKNKIFNVKDGDKEIKVKTRFGTSLKKVKSKIDYVWSLYDMYVADEYLLSRDEVIARIDAIDPNRRSDAADFATPEVDEKAPELDVDSQKRRFLITAHIAEKLLDDAVIKKLTDEMPKKKDGTLAKNKILRIASSRIVMAPREILEIVAKADTDTSFTVSLEFRKFSTEEVTLLENDFISRNSNILGLKFE